ncbi:MAG TPA: exosome subunit, partial [Archaeoglobus profundus]|nr:exosome subunit [Archaeoglobus profundus]
IVVRAKIVTYPAKREKIIEAAKEFIEKGYIG